MDLSTYVEDLRRRQAAHRPAGTPHEVSYPLPPETTLPGYVEHWAQERADKVAFVYGEASLTWAQLDEQSRRVAGGLVAAGVEPGDRVGLHLPNGLEFVTAFIAVLRAGAVIVPVNPLLQRAELTHELTDAGITALVSLGALASQIVPAAQASNVTCYVHVGEPAVAIPAQMNPTGWAQVVGAESFPEDRGDLTALASLNYTSGTSGLPKGCEHTQANKLYTGATALASSGQKFDGSFVSLCFIPVFWIAGEDIGILMPVVSGGTGVLMARWDADTALDAIEKHQVTTMVGTVETYLDLLNRDDLPQRDLSSLVDPLAMSFVRRLTPAVRATWAQAVGSHSVLREAAYGMTETHTCDVVPYGFHENDADLLAEPVFCGLPVPGTDIAVVDPITLEPRPLGEPGEILVRSPSVLVRYRNNDEATTRQLIDGWLRTGDNGFIDEIGALHYLGRDKELIKVSGMSVFPAEVEMLLAAHPDVVTAAVVPADDPRHGQRPIAFVQTTPGAQLSAEDLHAWARENMASYKVPTIEIVEQLPMTPTGKIRKVDLSSRAQEIADEG
ncbi:AMP-binding protein [Gephyromycinifex aptenodytis]|uniref:AMP-binding protein n=1 Tax=Gephyromycinifex aptenodytis TaxID=2716227 RepID=UPI001444CBD9|nr:AMP-binding protein [Gephyromycinifex aptenodytis]